MPFVLKHGRTGEIAACTLRNVYDFDYYGAKYWEDEQQALADRVRFLEWLGVGEAELEHWTVLQVDAEQLKRFNVKLNNDPGRRVLLDPNGTITVGKRLR